MSMTHVHMIISGDVQGVGFRAWARTQAQELALTGWVKNRADGAVEVVAEGERSSLTEFVKRCQRGPEVSWVERANVVWGQATGKFASFEVVY